MADKAKAIIVLIGFFAAPVPSLGNPQPVSDPGGDWVLQPAFSDEFDGPGLDLTKWNNDVGDWGTWTWEPANVEVNGGFLYVTTQYHPPEPPETVPTYSSGIIKSREEQGIRYGYFEARIKAAPLHPGVSPAFWGYRAEGDPSDWTWWTEIDFTELSICSGFPTCVSVSRHVGAHPDLPDPLHEAVAANVQFDPRDDFHVYGVEWNESEIQWYIDGVPLGNSICSGCTPPGSGTRENEWWHYPMDVIVSMGLRPPIRDDPGAGDPADFPTTFEVDYLRVWKLGEAIPAASERGMAGMALLLLAAGILVYTRRAGGMT